MTAWFLVSRVWGAGSEVQPDNSGARRLVTCSVTLDTMASMSWADRLGATSFTLGGWGDTCSDGLSSATSVVLRVLRGAGASLALDAAHLRKPYVFLLGILNYLGN